MEVNEIKKALYKEKPDAIFDYILEGEAYYHANLSGGLIGFAIPISEMGATHFYPTMDAKLLIRWLSFSYAKA